jgi:hypothetical protein
MNTTFVADIIPRPPLANFGYADNDIVQVFNAINEADHGL